MTDLLARLHPLVDVSDVDVSTTVLGAALGILHPDDARRAIETLRAELIETAALCGAASPVGG